MRISAFICLLLFCINTIVTAQSENSTDSIVSMSIRDTSTQVFILKKENSFPLKKLYLPAAMITYGFWAQSSHELKEFDTHVRNEIREDADFNTAIDNYLQYSPAAAVYALNALGIKGEHNFRDRTMIYVLSNFIMGAMVESIKKISKVQRPDGMGHNAFPSGHTATAFAAAEFLHQEYKNRSPWYGIAGYTAATTTGILRLYNNRHWFRDIVAGAGFGMLSTHIAYWLEPIIAKKIFHQKAAYHFNPASY